jgi:hypothetical protein
MVGWLSATTVCSGSLIYLLDLWGVMEEVMGGQVNCWLPSGLSEGLEGSGMGKSTGLFHELTIKELVFLHYEYYYSIFLLQQEASALWNTVVINNNGILIHFS